MHFSGCLSLTHHETSFRVRDTSRRSSKVLKCQRVKLGCDITGDVTGRLVFCLFPKASLMLGFSFSCSNRVGAIRKRRICGRYCYVTMLCVELSGCSCGGEGDGDEVTVLFAAVGGRCWGARLRRRICGRCCWG